MDDIEQEVTEWRMEGEEEEEKGNKIAMVFFSIYPQHLLHTRSRLEMKMAKEYRPQQSSLGVQSP